MSATRIQTLADEAILGRYRLSKQLGSGAFGTVWSARDERLDRDVAVKILPRSRVIHQRFEREARAAARLQHPAIVTLYEAAVDDDGAYLVSELVRGRTLDQLLAAGKLSDREIIEIAINICEALDHAHGQGVIHRDVKPSNILVAKATSNLAGRAKLTDFGVAHVVGGDSLTRTGDVIGTLAYMAPEQAQGREPTPSSDLYSLALVLYEALTGVNPIQDSRRTAALRPRRLGVFVPPIRRQRRDLDRQLSRSIDRALRPRPSERGELIDLQSALSAALDTADETRGVVGGWHDHETVADDPGPEWRERHDADGTPRLLISNAPTRVAGRGASHPAEAPGWPPRALAALGAGLAVAWLCAHLLTQAPLAPAAAGLLAAAATLLLPRLGWVATVAAIALLAADQGRTGGALLLAIVAAPPMILLGLRDGWSIPALAPALGMVGLGGAFPAVAGLGGRSWWQRAVLGASGYLWLVAGGLLAGRELYWLPAKLPRAHAWLTDPGGLIHAVLVPLSHSRGLAGALVWALAAALAPHMGPRRWPMLGVALSGIWAAVTVSAVQSLSGSPLRGAVVGGLVAAVVAGWGPLWTLTERMRDGAGKAPTVS